MYVYINIYYTYIIDSAWAALTQKFHQELLAYKRVVFKFSELTFSIATAVSEMMFVSLVIKT